MLRLLWGKRTQLDLAPSKTRCCVRDSQDFPACKKHVGKGWCCVEECLGTVNDTFIKKPVCNEYGSVPCTNLEEGTNEACCPKLTFYNPPTKASLDNFHCWIKRKDILAAERAQNDEESTTSSTTTASSTSTVSESPTGESNLPTSATSSPDSSPQGLTTGGIAGVVVGAVAGGVAIASLALWLLKRRKRTNNQAPMQPTSYEYYNPQNRKQERVHSPQEMDSQGGQRMILKPPAELGT
ncbi:hypothetical protein DER45DRAFT_588835 [Fusarium avenaceum]|nr:hypothetical protein DER45DRAFT_588835 [Fusarium avenaceum]